MQNNSECKITIVDSAEHGLNAEQNAMFMALCSRSTEGPEDNLAKVKAKGAANFMRQIYVGYGHSSVGKMGRTNIFFKGVSMLAAKELQANSLYIGQESSTRYIPFSKEGLVFPKEYGDTEKKFAYDLMDLYEEANRSVLIHVLSKYPVPEGADIGTWERGLKAHAFDITRSILPAGCKTTVGWCANLEELAQNIPVLCGSVYEEVRNIGRSLLEELIKVYPNSFVDDIKPYKFDDYAYIENEIGMGHSTIYLNGYIHDFYVTRERKDIIPLAISESATVEFISELDFGSFRDIQRHRNGYVQRGPFLGSLEEWYLSNMPADIADKFKKLATDIYIYAEDAGIKEGEDKYIYDYIMPMGTVCDVYCKFPIGNAVYVAELRSGVAVHPTARGYAMSLLKKLESKGLKLYPDTRDFTAFITKRANDNIENKN
jgi:thymidylate synthase ThyX